MPTALREIIVLPQIKHQKQNFIHLKLRYTDPCNLLNKRALLSQPIMLVVAKDSKISYYLNLSINSPTIILSIIWYTLNMIVPHKWTQIWSWWYQINPLSLVNLLLLIIKFSFICQTMMQGLYSPQGYEWQLPSNLKYETHRISKRKCFSSRLAVVLPDLLKPCVKLRMKM